MDLSQLQDEHLRWVVHNFPDQKSHEPLLGLAEEVGELAHAHLKHEQKIRGYDDDKYYKEAEDAVGDIVVYLASYCNRNKIDLAQSVAATWARVSQRDWIKFPVNGLTE